MPQTDPASSSPSVQRAERLITHLRDVTASLTLSSTQDDVLEAVLQPALQALDGRVGTALLLQGEQLRRAAIRGQPQAGSTIWQDGPLTERTPATDALRSGQPLYFEHGGALHAAYPALEGHTGARAAVASAVLPMLLSGQALGVLVLDFQEPHDFTAQERAFLQTLAAQAALALGHAGLSGDLERRVRERTAALDAFVALTEAIGSETDVYALARRATQTLRSWFPDCSAAYYELERDLWTLCVHTEDLNANPGLLAVLRAGLPQSTPIFAESVRTRTPVFVDGWDARREQVEQTEAYQTVATYPLEQAGDLRGMFTVGLQTQRRWTERDRAIFRAVGRSLQLALERGGQARQLQAQRDDLESRNRALEAYADLTRDLALDTDPYALVRRAQEVVLSLLPAGVAVYYEVEGPLWRLKSQVGDLRHPGLQAAVDAGLPYASAQNLVQPWTTGQPCYREVYDESVDQFQAEQVKHVEATATLPVLVGGRPRGVFGVALFHVCQWSRADRAVLETTVRSLGLALERAESVAQLAQRTQELERSNAELEQFAYVASHDLQEPLRSVTSFSQLLVSRFRDQDDEKAQRYVRYISEGTERMAQLIQDLLAFSRVTTHAEAFKPVETRLIAAQVLQDLRAQIEGSGTTVTLGQLPPVLGDPTQLRQLFQNLIGNAVKFRDPGRPARVVVDAAPQGEWAEFSVRDNGVGIEPEFFERIFVIFQRLHTRDRYEGNGMGLAIAKRIVERHGGTLGVTSTPGEGTTFRFTLRTVSPSGARALP